MTLLTALWPSITDDSGTKTSGTIIAKSLFDTIQTAIDDQTHSTVNTTIKPKTITDEVVAARGSKSSLTARLDVALGSDGTLTEVVTARGSKASLTARLDVSLNADGTLVTPGIVRLYSNGSVAGVQGGAGADGTMDSYTLPAGKLATNFQLARVNAQGTCAANANGKVIKIFFGGTSSGALTVAPNGGGWRIQAEIMRLGAVTQLFTVALYGATAAAVVYDTFVQTAPAETLANSILIKITGNGVAAPDIVLNFMSVEFLP